MSLSRLRVDVSSWLERGAAPHPFLAVLERLWARTAAKGVERPLTLPAGVAVIGVGGATLGGAGKTPYAIALARALAAPATAAARRGVILVGHAYASRVRGPRIVRESDDVREVGDEALVSVRALAGCGVAVVVARHRQEAIDFAARRAGVLVVDGLLQTRPTRLLHSVLVLDAATPWGSGRCPPLGDLRAPRESLLAGCDAVALVGASQSGACGGAHCAESLVHGAVTPEGESVPFESLANERLGLLLGVARPSRVIEGVRRLGVEPCVVARFADHHMPSARDYRAWEAVARQAGIQMWLATEKCATRLPARVAGLPVLRLAHHLSIPQEAIDRLVEKLESRSLARRK